MVPELLEGQARAEAWERLRAVWPTDDDHTDRAAGRELGVFRLCPVAGA